PRQRRTGSGKESTTAPEQAGGVVSLFNLVRVNYEKDRTFVETLREVGGLGRRQTHRQQAMVEIGNSASKGAESRNVLGRNAALCQIGNRPGSLKTIPEKTAYVQCGISRILGHKVLPNGKGWRFPVATEGSNAMRHVEELEI